MLFRVLNRKCGLICDLSEAICAESFSLSVCFNLLYTVHKMDETMASSHKDRALMMITGIIFSLAGYFRDNIPGLKSESKNVVHKSKNAITIASNRNKQ